ncbi:unnamed protein product [Durusdinium trenchii]|uniref:Uncharacterized protein n=1 Tax=Durusdinium trenchii TaxID=1381693 RepID=A0ABP0QCH4_9DINO
MTVPNPWLRRDQTAMCGSRGTCVGGSRVSFAHVMEVVDLDSATVERVALSKNERPAKHLRDFLAKHKFLHADRPRPSYVKGPEMYPIHVAAALGNAHILRMLLDAGADPTRRVDGKTAEGIAEILNREGSHAAFIRTLRERAFCRCDGQGCDVCDVLYSLSV